MTDDHLRLQSNPQVALKSSVIKRMLCIIICGKVQTCFFFLGGDRDMCSSWQLLEKPDKWQQLGDQGPQCNYGNFNTVAFPVCSGN